MTIQLFSSFILVRATADEQKFPHNFLFLHKFQF